MNYYISVNGTQRGPFPPDQLAAQGLRPDSMVWAEGMPQWERADRVPALLSVVAGLGAAPADPSAGQAPQAAQPVQGAPGAPTYGTPYGTPYGNYGPQPVQPAYTPYSGQPVNPVLAEAGSKKLVAGICGIFLGSLGVHKFILGYTTAGVIMLCVTLLTCGLGYLPMHIIGIVEGIMYLTKNDAEFYETYMVNKKEWF